MANPNLATMAAITARASGVPPPSASAFAESVDNNRSRSSSSSSNSNRSRIRKATDGIDPPRRARSLKMHERQDLADFFDNHDRSSDCGVVPIKLIDAMSAADLYDDVYAYDAPASYTQISKEFKEDIHAKLADIADIIAGNVVLASDADPSAITVPHNHSHEMVVFPDGAGGDPLGRIKAVHWERVCELHVYNVVESFVRSLRFGGAPRQMSLADLVRLDLRACRPHSLHSPQDGSGVTYLIMEADDRQVFFVAVGLRWLSSGGSSSGSGSGGARPANRMAEICAEPYTQWTRDLFTDLKDASVEFVSHEYFACPCV